MVLPRLSRPMVGDLLLALLTLLLTGPLRSALEVGTAGFSADDSERSVVLGWIVGLSMVGYAIGCWLKRPGLQSRVAVGDGLGCLLVGWLPVMLSLTILGAAIVLVELDVGADGFSGIVALLALAAVPVASGLRAMAAGGPPRFAAWRSQPWAEVLADAVLVASILPAALIWQDSISGIFLQNLDDEGLGVRLFATALTTGSFALFYFAPRLVLVVDRLRDRGPWITFAIVLVPVLWSGLVA